MHQREESEMIQERVVTKWVAEVKSELDRMAHDGMNYAKGDPFEHGVSVGHYQGLNRAIQILEEVIKDLDH